MRGEAFAGDGEHALDLCGMGGRLESRVSKEEWCREAQITTANAYTLALLQLVQESDDQRSVDFLECQARRRFAQPLFNELQELTEGVAIGTDGMRADLTLLH